MCLVCCYLRCVLEPPARDEATHFFFCFVLLLFNDCSVSLLAGASFHFRSLSGGADHMCHLGGALAGAAVGFHLRLHFQAAADADYAAGGAACDAAEADSAGQGAEHSGGSLALTGACLGFLALRAAIEI
jgi:hypothetical protein